MAVEKDLFALRSGHPTFYCCDNCDYLTLCCEEVGEVFADPRCFVTGFTEVCPQCDQVSTLDFKAANSDLIMAAGISGEYD